MRSGEMLRISPEEDRAGALRARAHLRHSNGSGFDQGRRWRADGVPAGPPRKMRGILGGSA
jgi:hypothetical protein